MGVKDKLAKKTIDFLFENVAKKEGTAVPAHAIGEQTPVKLSDWAQNYMDQYIVPIQADRMGGVGGPSYSANQLLHPQYKDIAWGSGQPGTATMIGNLAKDPRFGGVKNQIFTPSIGDVHMHKSNQIVHDLLANEFYKNKDKLTPDLINKINTYMQAGGPKSTGKLSFEPMPGFDVRDRDQLAELAKTFEKRKLISQHVFGGEGIGGRKAQIIPYEQILHETSDPLTHGADTFSIGPRAFRLTGNTLPEPRPDLNIAYPHQLLGEDLNVLYKNTPSEIGLLDFQNQWRKDTGNTRPLKSGKLPQPGYYEHTLGYTPQGSSERVYPRQKVTEDWIKELWRNSFAEGGLACLKEGGKTPAWQRKEGKNPEGGLNAIGRASYNRETGGNLKAPQPQGGARRDSFCARMKGMKKKLTSAETANDPDSRINKSLRKWKC